MQKKRYRIKDSKVKKQLKWHILRLLRQGNRTRKNLLDKLDDFYLGHWQVNEALIDAYLNILIQDKLVEDLENYKITEKGLEALRGKEKAIDKALIKGLSKEACAKYSLLGNVGLSALEFIIGFLSGSIGLIADAVHTAIDIAASAITWIGIKVDKEAKAALIGGIILCGIGAFIAYQSVTKIMEPAVIQFQLVALITIAVNILVNAFFSFYKFYVGGRTRSISLVADAYHTKTDIWSSVAVLVGLLGVVLGFPVLDALAGTAVSIFIIIGGIELIKESNKVMHGEDPKLEKFSKFLKGHLQILPERGAFVSLWLLNLRDMTKQENLEAIKKGLGNHFPVKLEDKDYESIYYRIEKDALVEYAGDKLRITDKGKKKLASLCQEKPAFLPWLHRKFVIDQIKLNWFAEGL